MFYSLKQGMVQNDVDEVKAVRYKQKSDYAVSTPCSFKPRCKIKSKMES